MRELIFDTETTGISPKNGERVVDLAFIELIDRQVTNRVFQRYCNPERDVPAEAAAIHGITSEFLKDKPLFADFSDELMAFLDGADTLIAHNSNFDIDFLNNEFALVRKTQPEKKYPQLQERFQVIDTLALARERYPGQKNSLDALCKRLHVDNSSRNLHGALLDAQILVEVYLLLTSEQTAMNLSSTTPAQPACQSVVPTPARASALTHGLVIQANANECTDHEAFLQKVLKRGAKPLLSD